MYTVAVVATRESVTVVAANSESTARGKHDGGGAKSLIEGPADVSE